MLTKKKRIDIIWTNKNQKKEKPKNERNKTNCCKPWGCTHTHTHTHTHVVLVDI